MNNPAEQQLIRNGETGLLIDNPQSFANALNWLTDHPEQYQRLSRNAATEIRHRFSIHRTYTTINEHYTTVLLEKKKTFDFQNIFGVTPGDWFRSCQDDERWRFSDIPTKITSGTSIGPHYLYEQTKGSVFHYSRTFPDDPRLTIWVNNLKHHR
jgi:hypothetical protein